MSVFVPVRGCPLHLVSTDTGVGEGYSCPEARVEVRVDREPAAGARGTGVSAASGLPGAGRGRREGRREGKFRGTGGERCVG